jgi:ribose transport system substrate-binding protein
VELLEVNNRYRTKVALRNAEQLIRERMAVVLGFQTYENVAPVIAARFVEAGIPLIAIEIPHPGAIYFGANNYPSALGALSAFEECGRSEQWTERNCRSPR